MSILSCLPKVLFPDSPAPKSKTCQGREDRQSENQSTPVATSTNSSGRRAKMQAQPQHYCPRPADFANNTTDTYAKGQEQGPRAISEDRGRQERWSPELFHKKYAETEVYILVRRSRNRKFCAALRHINPYLVHSTININTWYFTRLKTTASTCRVGIPAHIRHLTFTYK